MKKKQRKTHWNKTEFIHFCTIELLKKDASPRSAKSAEGEISSQSVFHQSFHKEVIAFLDVYIL